MRVAPATSTAAFTVQDTGLGPRVLGSELSATDLTSALIQG